MREWSPGWIIRGILHCLLGKREGRIGFYGVLTVAAYVLVNTGLNLCKKAQTPKFFFLDSFLSPLYIGASLCPG